MKYLVKSFFFVIFIFLFFLLYKIAPLEYRNIKFHFFYRPNKEIASFSTEENKKISLFLKKYKNRSVWSFNLKDIAQEIQKIFPSKEIYLKRKLVNTIEVYMKESQPILFALNGAGEISLYLF